MGVYVCFCADVCGWLKVQNDANVSEEIWINKWFVLRCFLAKHQSDGNPTCIWSRVPVISPNFQMNNIEMCQFDFEINFLKKELNYEKLVLFILHESVSKLVCDWAGLGGRGGEEVHDSIR